MTNNIQQSTAFYHLSSDGVYLEYVIKPFLKPIFFLIGFSTSVKTPLDSILFYQGKTTTQGYVLTLYICKTNYLQLLSHLPISSRIKTVRIKISRKHFLLFKSKIDANIELTLNGQNIYINHYSLNQIHKIYKEYFNYQFSELKYKLNRIQSNYNAH